MYSRSQELGALMNIGSWGCEHRWVVVMNIGSSGYEHRFILDDEK